MQNNKKPVVLITGASSGIGCACAKALHSNGYRVYGTSRTPSGSDSEFKLIKMDVSDGDSVKNAVQMVLEETGRIDVVVNNAGIGYGGSVEDTSLEEAKITMETNFYGPMRVCKAVLPVMRSQGKGLIVNISSLGGLIGLPYVGLYSASKFALEGMTEALRLEVKPFGIHVVVIDPGDIATGFTKNRRLCEATGATSAYNTQFQRTLKIIERNEIEGSSPDIVVKTLLRVLRSRSPKHRYIAATFIEKLAVVLSKILPEKIFAWAFSKYYDM